MIQSILPPEQPSPPEFDANRALVNIITAISDIIQENGDELASDWAESAGYPEANIFMRERAKEVLAQMLAAYFDRAQPKPHQFTDAHASAYLGIPPASGGTGTPVKK